MPWSLICWNIINFLPRITAKQVTEFVSKCHFQELLHVKSLLLPIKGSWTSFNCFWIKSKFTVLLWFVIGRHSTLKYMYDMYCNKHPMTLSCYIIICKSISIFSDSTESIVPGSHGQEASYFSTVELRWLELKGTVKMCSSYQKFEPLRSRNFTERENPVLTQDSFIMLW